MNLKKYKILSVFIIFLLMFPLHYVYDKFPNSLTSIFCPVNESIWEHLKLIFTSYMIYGIISYFVYIKNKIDVNNFIFDLFITSIINIIIFLIIFIPIYNVIGENLVVTLSIFFVTEIITQFISYFILKKDNIKYLNIISFILIIVSYIIFGYLTYNPIKTELFFDPINKSYGINTYVI